MKRITLIVSDVDRLNEIKAGLYNGNSLNKRDHSFLYQFLSQLPSPEDLLLENLPSDAPLSIKAWDLETMNKTLDQWEKLFTNLPGWDYSPTCIIFEGDAVEELRQNILMSVIFAPSFSYNSCVAKEGYEVRLKDDGTAKFWFPTFDDSELYPELSNFRGTWKEAYFILIETLKKGWPMEAFPDELRQFLKKE